MVSSTVFLWDAISIQQLLLPSDSFYNKYGSIFNAQWDNKWHFLLSDIRCDFGVQLSGKGVAIDHVIGNLDTIWQHL